MKPEEEKQAELMAALEEFADMQRHHAALLDEGRLRNLPEWAEKRQRAFSRLRQCLDRFDPAEMDGAGREADQLRALMREILHEEETLREQVGGKMAALRKEIDILRRGKTVLKGYRLDQGSAPPPKYLSSKA